MNEPLAVRALSQPLNEYVTINRLISTGLLLNFMYRIAIAYAVITAMWLVSCGGPSPQVLEVTATLTEAEKQLAGTLIDEANGDPLSGRQVVLCAVTEVNEPQVTCTLQAQTATTNLDGTFTLENVEPESYVAFISTGLAPFDEAVAAWADKEIKLHDWDWLKTQFLGGVDYINVPVPQQADAGPLRASYALNTLLAEGSPFMAVAEVRTTEVSLPEGFDTRGFADDDGGPRSEDLFEQSVVTRLTLTPTIFEVGGQNREALTLTTPIIKPFDREAIRSEIGPFVGVEADYFDGDVVARWNNFIAGDDAAFRDLDAEAIRQQRAGNIYRIENTRIASIDERDGELVKVLGYTAIDVQTGEKVVAGWWDEATGDVIEARTLYRLNVRDHSGVRIENGPGGEQFYHYGFSYYRPWQRILPDPVAFMVSNFYIFGSRNVEDNLTAYGSAAAAFGGDMNLLDWDTQTDDDLRAWRPNDTVSPFILMPDSGTVDIRRERMAQAAAEGQVVVDRDSVIRFMTSNLMDGMTYANREEGYPSIEDVENALLYPYRTGYLFNDMEVAIILGATYQSEEPLLIRIDSRLDSGFRVPRSGGANEILVSYDELAWVILAYPGALNSRWAHEMGHVLDFNSNQYTFRGRPIGGSRCEPLKYMMEYMWWVQSYPGDAPEWDWMPINSGLTLARLLTDTYHNSGC